MTIYVVEITDTYGRCPPQRLLDSVVYRSMAGAESRRTVLLDQARIANTNNPARKLDRWIAIHPIPVEDRGAV